MSIRIISSHGTTAVRCSKCGKHPRSLTHCRRCDEQQPASDELVESIRTALGGLSGLEEKAVRAALEASGIERIQEEARKLDWLAENSNLELSWGEIDGDMSDCAWRVHRRNGGYNDREWTLIATAETPSAAIEAARTALSADMGEDQ